MKKFLGVLLVVVLVLVVVGAILVTVVLRNLGPIVKSALETRLPEMLGTDVSVEDVDISLRSGIGEIRGLVIGNPEGYKSPEAFRLDRIAVALDVASLRSGTIIIREIDIQQPEVTFEGGLLGSNLSEILDNVSEGEETDADEPPSPTDGEAPSEEKEPPVIIESLLLTDGEVHLVAPTTDGKSATISLMNVEMADLGAEEGGVQPRMVMSFIVGTVVKSVFTSVLSAPDLAFEGADALKGLAQSGIQDATALVEGAATQVLRGAVSGIGGVGDGADAIIGGVGGLLGGVVPGGEGVSADDAVRDATGVTDEAAADLQRQADEAVAEAESEVEATMRDLEDDVDAAAEELEKQSGGLLGGIFGGDRDPEPADEPETPAGDGEAEPAEKGEEPVPAVPEAKEDADAVEDAVGGILGGLLGGGD